jgi:hypothetical protein
MGFAPFIPAALGAIGGLSSLFGKDSSRRAAEQEQQELEEAERQIQAATQQGLGLLSPFRGAGTFAISPLEQMLGQDPTDIVNKILGQYQQSPAQQFQSQQAQKALESQLAGAGLAGSGEAIQRAGGLAQQLASQGQEKYLQDVLGQRQQQMGGLERLFGGGLSAATTGAGLLGEEGRSLAGLTGQIGQAQAAGTLGRQQNLSNLFGGLGQLGGLIGGGGFGGLSNLFGGGSQWINPDTGMGYAPGGFAPEFGF